MIVDRSTTFLAAALVLAPILAPASLAATNAPIKWATPLNGTGQILFGKPVVADLDGDGRDDVAFGSFNEYAYVLKGTNGTVLPGWPVFIRDSIASSTAMADLDGDGNLEVIMGADSHFEGSPIDTPNGGGIFVFRK